MTQPPTTGELVATRRELAAALAVISAQKRHLDDLVSGDKSHVAHAFQLKLNEASHRITTLERELEEARKKAGKLHDYASMRDVQVSQLASFAKWAIREGAFGGSELDGAEVQEQALADCLIVRTVYDPERHGPSDVAEPGDDWFEFSSTLSEDSAALQVEERKP